MQVLKKSLKNKPAGSLTVEHYLAYRSTDATHHDMREPSEAVPRVPAATHLPVYGEARPRDSDAPEALQQQQQANDHNTKRLPGDTVAVRLFRGRQEKWAQGEVIQCLGPVSYMVRINKKVSHVHIDHLVAATETASFSDAQLVVAPTGKQNKTKNNNFRSKSPDAEVRNPSHTLDLTPEVLPHKPTHQGQRTAEVPGTPAKASNRPERGMATTPAKEPERSSPGGRYPARTRKPPERLDLRQTRPSVRRGKHKNTRSFCFRFGGLAFVTTNILRFRFRVV